MIRWKMSEPKTLKELPMEAGPGECYYGCHELLKDEAIKWYKYYMEDDAKLLKEMNQQQLDMNRSRALWIKHFFNITDEELK